MFESSDHVYFLPAYLTNHRAKWAVERIDQSSCKMGCGTHMWSKSCMMIGQVGWEKIDLIRALKHVASMLAVAVVAFYFSLVFLLLLYISKLVHVL